jgi:hypothetical protein
MVTIRDIGQTLKLFVENHGKMLSGDASMLDAPILHPILWGILSFTLGLFLWGFFISLIPTKDKTEELRNNSEQNGEDDDGWIINKNNLTALILCIVAVYVLGRLFYSYTLQTLINQGLIS